MAAFERVKSGIPEMDAAFDNIRLGDNVVWRVSDLSEFRLFMEPYVEQAKEDGRNIIYFRFASHEPLITDCPEVKTIELPLSHRFETFTVEIHNIIEREGKDAFYVRASGGVGHGSDDGEFLQSHLSVSVYSGYRCVFPDHQGETFRSFHQ